MTQDQVIDSVSDTRAAARRFFNVDAASIVLGVLTELVRRGELKHEVPGEAIRRYRLDDDISTVFGTA